MATAKRSKAGVSLAADLARRPDDELVALLLARPDLARPVPADLTALAARAATAPSVARALERLDAGARAVLRATRSAAHPTPGAGSAGLEAGMPGKGLPEGSAAPAAARTRVPPTSDDLRAALGLSPEQAPELEAVLGRLRALALVWEDGRGWTAVPTAAGLLAVGGEGGEPESAAPVPLQAPEPESSQVGVAAADRVGGAAARETLVHLDLLAELWSHHPPRVLRAGGLGVRELAQVARQLEISTEQAAWVIETASAAGLVANDGEADPTWAPTPDYDAWTGREAAARWVALTRAWLASPRAAYLVGTPIRSGRAAGQVSALGPDAFWPPARALRLDVLGELARLAPGEAPTASSLLARLAWRRPARNPAGAADAVAAVIREAHWLGLVGLGALTTAGRALIEGGDHEALAGAIDASLPTAVDHVLLQADLTVVAPGPLEGELAQLMGLVADVESRGGATVLRMSPTSVRRALDTGLVADELLAQLARFSRTPVPQPVDYLVRDVARRHGQVRVGGATAYVRSDDEVGLAAMLADRALGPALLRRIAPTVLVSRAKPAVLLELLRDNGYAPAQEAADGMLIVAPRPVHRARLRRHSAHGQPTLAPVDATVAAAIVAALRVAPPRPPVGAAPSGALATDPLTTTRLLRQAASDSLAVWIGYADRNGRTNRHLVRPVRVDGGRVYAVSGESLAEQVFLLHRITGVAAS